MTKEHEPQRQRGGQPGNQNAVTHGAYAAVHWEDLPAAERRYLEGLTLDTKTNLLRQLRTLLAKEADLQARIQCLRQGDPDALYVDRVVQTLKPGQGREKGGAERTATEMVVKTSSFDRVMKLEAELNRTQGRLLKLLDAAKAYELECRRANLEEKKYRLAKQKLLGAYEVDPVTGEVNDAYDPDTRQEG